MANNHINSDDTQSTRSLPRKDSRRGLAATGWLIAVLALVSLNPRVWADDAAVNLPAGVKAVWDVHPAYHETTPTRERICLNGLWRWQPPTPMRTKSPPRIGDSSKCRDAGRASPTTCRRIPRRSTRIQAGRT